MATKRIKGITIEIGGDTTKLQTALKGVNIEIRNTHSKRRDVDKLLELDRGFLHTDFSVHDIIVLPSCDEILLWSSGNVKYASCNQ